MKKTFMSSVFALVVLFVLGGGAVFAQNQTIVADRMTLTAPSREYPTIQSAIDAVPDGGRVTIPTGEFVESLRIEGKIVDLIGKDGARPTVLIAPDSRRALITYGPRGGGSIRRLLLKDGAFGILGESRFDPRSDRETPPATITVEDSRISGSIQGVFGKFSELNLFKTEISGTAWNGITILKAEDLKALKVFVHDTGNVGLLLKNFTLGLFPLEILNSTFSNNAQGGIAVIGHGRPVVISGSEVKANSVAGIYLLDAGTTHIDKTQITATTVGQSPQVSGVGDGLIVWSSPNVFVQKSDIVGNERAGVLVLGCSPEHLSHVLFSKSKISSNRFGIVLQTTQKLAETLFPCSGTSTGASFSGPQAQFFGNTERNIDDNGTLSVPNGPTETP